MPIPDQSPRSKAMLSVPETKVEEKVITDYTKQAEAMDKTRLDGLDLDKDIIFETLKKLKAKEKRKKKGKKEAPKSRKKLRAKKIKALLLNHLPSVLD